MYKSSAFKIVSGKLAGAPLLSTSTILPSSLLLIGGIVAWQFWKKQGQLQSQTSELRDDLKKVEKQVAKIKEDKDKEKDKVARIKNKVAKIKVDSKSVAQISSSFKKFFNR